LPETKTTGGEGADLYLIESPLSSNHINVLDHHLASSPVIPNDALLFAWQTADGAWAPMTKDWFMSQCNEVWTIHSLVTMDGHSFQIGSKTEHLMSGVDPWVVMVIGCWYSLAFLAYWCKVEEILPNFISEAYQSIQTLTMHMSQFVQNMSLP